MEELLQQIGTVVNSWKTLGAVAGLIALVNLLTWATKLPFLSKYIKAAWRPWIAMGLGTIGGILSSMAGGVGIWSASLSGLLMGLGAIGAHQGMLSVKPGEAAKASAASTVAEAMKGPEAEVRVKVEALKADLDRAASEPDKKKRLKSLAKLAATR